MREEASPHSFDRPATVSAGWKIDIILPSFTYIVYHTLLYKTSTSLPFPISECPPTSRLYLSLRVIPYLRGLHGLELDSVCQGADAFEADFDDVAVFEVEWGVAGHTDA